MRFISILAAGLLFFGWLLSGCVSTTEVDIHQITFERLEKIRSDKKAAILFELVRLRKKADQAPRDPTLMDEFFRLRDQTPANHSQRSKALAAITALDQHFVAEYGVFYDLLFIRKDGFVFHSIRMESDFRSNLFHGPLSATHLARALRKSPQPRFVDYDYYGPSAEAAAFFLNPVLHQNQVVGWMALQLDIHPINRIMTDYGELGQTGESYLANDQNWMLTQSRFYPHETSLQQRIETRVTEVAPQQNSGQMVIEDYRRVRVLSVFEKVVFEGVSWVLIVEMDEDEILAEQFLQNPDFYLSKILEKPDPGEPLADGRLSVGKSPVRVDVNEFARGKPGRHLLTRGVATCTGVVITYPDQFSYLGHIYPLDTAYHSPWKLLVTEMGLWWRGVAQPGNTNDLLGLILHRITQFEIPKSKIRDLKVVLVAVHTESFKGIVQRLLAEGIYLSQITILHAPKMRHANIVVESANPVIAVEWEGEEEGALSRSNRSRNLGEMVTPFLSRGV
ncbi:MAG: hypothetical protein HQL52_08200 [Magnetococcales bacterium]|nr:hypothetical protein [Magnetococcales bacterium]